MGSGELRFGDFVLDLEDRTLHSGGKPCPLPPKAIAVLLALVEKHGRIVEKADLLDRAWPGTFVEEGNLTYTVRLLRKALGDDAESPRFIETVPKRGYRFIADVSAVRVKVQEEAYSGETAAPPIDSTVPEIPYTAANSTDTNDEAQHAGAGGRHSASMGSERLFKPLAVAVLVLFVGGVGYLILSGSGGEPTRGKKSIVVLPFVNEVGPVEMEYLSDGISESLINQLSELDQLRVVARGTAFRYKGRRDDAKVIGDELHVDVVLTGKVSQVDDMLVVQADLVDVATGSQLWGQRYTRKFADLPKIPEAISKAILNRLLPKLEGEGGTQFARLNTSSGEAYQLDLKGRFFWNRRTEEGLQKGVGYFEQAIAEDPGYAPAYVGLADSFNVMGFYSFLPPDQAFPKAKTAATKALQLNGELAEAHNSLAYATMYYDWDLEAAESSFRRAIELKPNYSVGHQWYGNLLTATGRWDDAIRSFKRAQELDPLSPVITAVPAWTYYYARQYDKAVEPCRMAIELDPGFALAHTWLGQAYERKGDHEKAISEFKESLRISKTSPEVRALLAHAYAVSGDKRMARSILEELLEVAKGKYVSPYHIATIYAGLGETGTALGWLEKSLSDRQHVLLFLEFDSRLDNLRSEPRYQGVASRIRKASLQINGEIDPIRSFRKQTLRSAATSAFGSTKHRNSSTRRSPTAA